MSLLVAFVRSARRPAVARRCLIIALVVGTALSLVNQWDAIREGHIGGLVGLRILVNYVVPFVVSNLGAMSSQDT